MDKYHRSEIACVRHEIDMCMCMHMCMCMCMCMCMDSCKNTRATTGYIKLSLGKTPQGSCLEHDLQLDLRAPWAVRFSLSSCRLSSFLLALERSRANAALETARQISPGTSLAGQAAACTMQTTGRQRRDGVTPATATFDQHPLADEWEPPAQPTNACVRPHAFLTHRPKFWQEIVTRKRCHS